MFVLNRFCNKIPSRIMDSSCQY